VEERERDEAGSASVPTAPPSRDLDPVALRDPSPAAYPAADVGGGGGRRAAA
jgi:hypothetical protein